MVVHETSNRLLKTGSSAPEEFGWQTSQGLVAAEPFDTSLAKVAPRPYRHIGYSIQAGVGGIEDGGTSRIRETLGSAACPVTAAPTATLSVDSGGDQKVQLAFQAGWEVVDLYNTRIDLAQPEPPPSAKLPGLDALTPRQRALMRVHRLAVMVNDLADWSKVHGVDAPATTAIETVLAPPPDAQAFADHQSPDEALASFRDTVRKFHVAMLDALNAVDPRLCTSYRLGRELAETTRAQGPSLEQYTAPDGAFQPWRVQQIRHDLLNLKSAYKPYAATAVSATLQEWEIWLQRPRTKTPKLAIRPPSTLPDTPDVQTTTRNALVRQGEIWRALLSGEEKPTDLLRTGDYLNAASGLLRQTLGFAGRFLKRYGLVLVIVLAALVGAVVGVALLAYSLTHSFSPTSTTNKTTGTSTVPAILGGLSALGFSWAGLRATLGRALTQAESPLWQTVVSRAVGDAAVRLPNGVEPLGADSGRFRREQSRVQQLGRSPRPDIRHVVVLALENRSFDHMLGFLDHPKGAEFDGLTGMTFTNPGVDGTVVAATAEAKTVLPVDPDHAHEAVVEQLAVTGKGSAGKPTNQGFIASYDRKCRGLAKVAYGGLLSPIANWIAARRSSGQPAVDGRGPLAMLCQPSTAVPALSRLAVDFAVCTRWFCSVPGETWPNRNFMHAATSDGETDIDLRFYDNRTIFELLEEARRSWRIYHDDTPQLWAFSELWDTPERHANWYEYSEFAKHAAAGDLATYSFIEPNHRPPLHTLDHEPIIGSPDVSDNQHPGNNLVKNASYDGFTTQRETDFTRADRLIAQVYEALRANTDLFRQTVLVITYDEHGGLVDHVPPPTDAPAPGGQASMLGRLFHIFLYRKAKAFDFHMLGPRVPAVIVSPLIEAQTIDDLVHEHSSIPSTLRALFAAGADPLNARDAWAAPFHTVLTRREARSDLPDLSAIAHVPAQPPAAAVAQTEEPVIPEHYQPFVKLAEKTRRRLRRKGVPEAQPKTVSRRTAPRAKAQLVTQAFVEQAKRARGTTLSQ